MQYRAFAARCPHYGAPLADGLLHGQRLLCPWHQSMFEAAGGDLLQPPALQALPSYPVTVRDGEVLVDLPEDAPRTRTMPMAAFDPDADPRTFVVVGEGAVAAAAVAAAAVAAMREGGYQGRIVLVSAEDRWPYDRPNLSKDYLAGEAGEDWLALRPDGFYDEHGIERRHDTVTALDVATRRILLAGGGKLTPDAVLIASGAAPRRLDVPGTGLDGVLALRSRDDCDRLLERIATAAHIVVAGASFIGMEAAASLVHRGADVTVVAPEAVPFATTLGPAGAAVHAAHEAAGTRFRLGRRPVALHGEGSVRSVELDDGERLPADLVLAGIGVRPATAFVHGVKVHDDGGLGVDEQLRLAPGVWAGGDVARYPEAHVGEPVRIEHWRLAMQHGRAAGFAMAGAARRCSAKPRHPPATAPRHSPQPTDRASLAGSRSASCRCRWLKSQSRCGSSPYNYRACSSRRWVLTPLYDCPQKGRRRLFRCSARPRRPPATAPRRSPQPTDRVSLVTSHRQSASCRCRWLKSQEPLLIVTV